MQKSTINKYIIIQYSIIIYIEYLEMERIWALERQNKKPQWNARGVVMGGVEDEEEEE
jgi:hypothetical protein